MGMFSRSEKPKPKPEEQPPPAQSTQSAEQHSQPAEQHQQPAEPHQPASDQHVVPQAPQPQELPGSEAISAAPQNPQHVNEPPPAKSESAYIQPPPPAYSPNDNQKEYEAQRQRLVTPLARLGEEPADVDCPYCRQVTTTRVAKNDSSMTIISGVLIGLLCICLACLPCCMGACADVDHFCSRCGKPLTHRPYDGQTQVVANLPQDMVPSQFPNNQSVPPQQQQHRQHPQQPQPATYGHAT